jgi:hypothetical protein
MNRAQESTSAATALNIILKGKNCPRVISQKKLKEHTIVQ